MKRIWNLIDDIRSTRHDHCLLLTKIQLKGKKNTTNQPTIGTKRKRKMLLQQQLNEELNYNIDKRIRLLRRRKKIPQNVPIHHKKLQAIVKEETDWIYRINQSRLGLVHRATLQQEIQPTNPEWSTKGKELQELRKKTKSKTMKKKINQEIRAEAIKCYHQRLVEAATEISHYMEENKLKQAFTKLNVMCNIKKPYILPENTNTKETATKFGEYYQELYGHHEHNCHNIPPIQPIKDISKQIPTETPTEIEIIQALAEYET